MSLQGKTKLDANGNDITINLYTLLTDNLGSVVAITDEQANVTQRFYYTPFGEQKQIDGKTLDAPLMHKGFTGHEEVECINLIHMSGRMYDPRIGRFLSADPFVQDYENQQTLNRYSYCLNNPITFTDPSGYWSLSDFFDSICDIFKNLFSANGLTSLLGIAIAALAFANPLFGGAAWAWLNSAVATAAFTGAATAASGGSLENVLLAMGTSFATALIWHGTGDFLGKLTKDAGEFTKWTEKTLVHGIVGGGIQAAEGGSFKDGFLGAAVAEAVSGKLSDLGKDNNFAMRTTERVTAAYIIGGTAAAVTGGNFQNGAKTAAYAELFNDIADEVGKYAIKMQRIAESPNSTLGTLTATDPNGKSVSMYTLELGGPSSDVEGSMKRVPAGTYDVKPYNSEKFHDKYELLSTDPSNHRTNILIHTGNEVGNTHGCIIVGTDPMRHSNGSYYIPHGRTLPAFDTLHNLIGNHRARLTIEDIP